MTMMTINSTAGLNELMALAREIETVEGVTRRIALVRALHQWDEITAIVAADCRYVPVGWSVEPHVSFSIGPMVWDAADPVLAAGL